MFRNGGKMKKYLKYILSVIIIIMCVGGGIGVGIYYAKGKVYSRLNTAKREEIEQFFEIELPEQCELIDYRNTLQRDAWKGCLIVGLRFNTNDREKILKQLKKEYFMDVDVATVCHILYNEGENRKYKNLAYDLREVSNCFEKMGGVKRELDDPEHEKGSPLTVYTYAVVLEEQRGSFQVFFYYNG